MRPMIFAFLMALMLAAASAQAAPPHFYGVYLAANGVWYDAQGVALPNEFEGGLSAKASFSPHISAVGSGDYGFEDKYLRGSAGVRVTATNVDDPNFSIGLGMEYQFADKTQLRPREWFPNVTVGWRPWSEYLPKLLIVGQGGYGMTTHQAQALAGLRYALSE